MPVAIRPETGRGRDVVPLTSMVWLCTTTVKPVGRKEWSRVVTTVASAATWACVADGSAVRVAMVRVGGADDPEDVAAQAPATRPSVRHSTVLAPPASRAFIAPSPDQPWPT